MGLQVGAVNSKSQARPQPRPQPHKLFFACFCPHNYYYYDTNKILLHGVYPPFTEYSDGCDICTDRDVVATYRRKYKDRRLDAIRNFEGMKDRKIKGPLYSNRGVILLTSLRIASSILSDA